MHHASFVSTYALSKGLRRKPRGNINLNKDYSTGGSRYITAVVPRSATVLLMKPEQITRDPAVKPGETRGDKTCYTYRTILCKYEIRNLTRFGVREYRTGTVDGDCRLRCSRRTRRTPLVVPSTPFILYLVRFCSSKSCNTRYGKTVPIPSCYR